MDAAGLIPLHLCAPVPRLQMLILPTLPPLLQVLILPPFQGLGLGKQKLWILTRILTQIVTHPTPLAGAHPAPLPGAGPGQEDAADRLSHGSGEEVPGPHGKEDRGGEYTSSAWTLTVRRTGRGREEVGGREG